MRIIFKGAESKKYLAGTSLFWIRRICKSMGLPDPVPLVRGSVVDPDSLNPDTDPVPAFPVNPDTDAVLDPVPVPDPGF